MGLHRSIDSMPAPGSLRKLLARSIDYAGMFPPCALALAPALKNQAVYVRSADDWMLGSFVLPVAQFDAASGQAGQFDETHPLCISALGPKTENKSAFISALREMATAIRGFAGKHGERASVTQLEMLLPPDPDLALLDEARRIVEGLEAQTFWEAPAGAAAETIALLAEQNRRTEACAVGYKLRTGGVTAEAFPDSTPIARALVAAAREKVPIKFTAGLHHPVRQFRNEVKTKMHGFLNVLGAGVLAAEHGWNEERTAEMLDDEEASSFLFKDEFFVWRDWKIGIDQLEARRKFVTSFGSCSFDEPREDLRALKLL
jgi:hypothetical protein